MMRPAHDLAVVYLCRAPVDFRKSINGLATLVEGTLSMNPFSEYLFAFINRKRDKVKCLYWERAGFVLWYKRLERGRFHWPRFRDGEVITLSGQELNWLLDGIDLRQLKPHPTLTYQSVL
ncbi:MAG: IS66 family insertion sequence element accessory protein TnpB [Anaerolineae bacterium]|nr:IS66 family insertion sequence element accessory protein TnpB [Anaerolineae bacterium]